MKNMEYRNDTEALITIKSENTTGDPTYFNNTIMELIEYLTRLHLSGMNIRKLSMDIIVSNKQSHVPTKDNLEIDDTEIHHINDFKDLNDHEEMLYRLLEENLYSRFPEEEFSEILSKICDLYVKAFKCNTDHILFRLDDIDYMDINKLFTEKNMHYYIRKTANAYQIMREFRGGY